MSNFILIFLCLIVGILLRKTGRFPTTTATSLNALIIYVSFPAVVLLQIPKLMATTDFTLELLVPVSMAWIQFALAWLLMSYLAKKRNWSQARKGALILTAGLGNTSFVGFPLLEALYGSQAIRWGVLIDQLGSFLVLSTLGLLVASTHGYRRDGKTVKPLKQIASFPPFIALAVATFLGLAKIELGMMNDVIAKLAATLVPLALIAVGFQLRLSPSVLHRYWRPLTLGLTFKLVLVPIFFCIFYYLTTGGFSYVTKLTILESAMATMITSAVVASDFGLDEELANLMVGVSIPLSLLSVPLWNNLLMLLEAM